jgi:hypothetical protein
LNPTVNTQVGDMRRIPFVKPKKDIANVVAKLSSTCIEIKKLIDIKYVINGARVSPLAFEQLTAEDSVYLCIVNEIQLYVEILINEAIIDSYICKLYELSNDDMKHLSDKMGVCVANIPVYKEALGLFIDTFEYESENIQSFLNVIELVDYSVDELNEVCELIRSVLFQKNNEIEDFCALNEINPITVWYLVKTRNIIPVVKAKQLAFEWFVLALKDILMQDDDGVLSITDTDNSITDILDEYANKKGISSAQMLQLEEFIGNKIKSYCEKFFFVDLMNYTNVFMYMPKTPFIWHVASGENRGFEAFTIIYKWNRDSIYKLKSKYLSKRREKLEFRMIQLGNATTAQAQAEKELISKQMQEIENFSKKLDELISEGYDPKLDDGVGKNIAPLQNKQMLKAEVLNKKQLEKYLKAEW